MKTLLALLLLIPSLSWGDHKSSDNLTGKAISCYNDGLKSEFIIFFTKYSNKILNYSLFGKDYWSNEHSKFDIKDNQNIAYMYLTSRVDDTNRPSERFFIYQTDLTSIVLLNIGYYQETKILNHINKNLNGKSAPSGFIGKISRQDLTYINSSDIISFCELVDGDPIKYIDSFKNPYLQGEKNKMERLKRNQKI